MEYFSRPKGETVIRFLGFYDAGQVILAQTVQSCVRVCVCVCVCVRARALSSVQCKEAANENLLLNVTLFMLLFFSVVVVVLCVCLKNAITSQTTK